MDQEGITGIIRKNTNTVTVKRFGSGLYDTRYEFTAAENQPKNIFQIKYREKLCVNGVMLSV